MDDAQNAQQTADAVAAHMWARDRASKALGMRIVAVSEGAAFLEMTVRDDMLNGFDLCHGGIVTTLADSAFAFACNSRGDVTVAAGLDVELLAAARKGDVLTARAFEVASTGRTGVYDITVTNQRGETVALVRGRAHRLKDQRVLGSAGAAA
jgi:acyl-CoA thioesterase